MSTNNPNKLNTSGAGAGASGGSVLSGDSAAGTVGGAVVEGVIGHEVARKRE